ncbi:TetR/AcrR family transcriptional regulator [Amycolatopsis sp. NPDC059021]|uniref:TetR/AcrR family transcriptional regulator n=1 Tax=Amycolatopsis sp. NPDC059021 TaxID=3346704 RepID=UPI0036701854
MPSVKSRREQYSQATKAALIEAATRRFAEHGFAGTSLEDVAADIQATRGAVYHHFSNKTSLFRAVFDELETEMMRQVTESRENSAGPWQAALAAMAKFLDQCCDPVYGRVVWQEAPLALGWREWQECEEKYAYGFIEQTLRELVDNGEVRPLPLGPTTRITFHILGTAGMALAEASEEDKPRIRAEYAEVIGQLLSGIRIEKPS